MRKLIILASILVPTAALAGGYTIPNENARDLALGQAAVADQTGPEALFLNTAALAGPEGLAISASGELLINQTTWTDSTLGTASLVPQNNLPPTAAISYGARLGNGMRWGAGIGFGVPGGGALIWPNGWQGQQYIQTVRQQVFLIGGGAAFQPMPGLKIGASFLRYQAEEELHQSINYLDHMGDAGLGLAGGASTFGLALEYRVPSIPLVLGVNYKHSGDLALRGDAHFTGVPAALTPMIHDQRVSEALTVPNVLDIGAAYEVMPHLKVMVDYTFERWSVYKSDTFIGDDGFTVTVPRNYNNAHIIRVGGEWAALPFLPALTGRLGVLRSLSDQPTDTVSPSLSDGNSWALSIGAGYNVLPSLRVDIGYQHAFFDKVTATGPETLPGSYETKVDLLSIGLNWRTDLGLGYHE